MNQNLKKSKESSTPFVMNVMSVKNERISLSIRSEMQVTRNRNHCDDLQSEMTETDTGKLNCPISITAPPPPLPRHDPNQITRGSGCSCVSVLLILMRRLLLILWGSKSTSVPQDHLNPSLANLKLTSSRATVSFHIPDHLNPKTHYS